MDDSIENFMTHSVHTVGMNRTLQDAHRMMAQHHIRHLPVLDGGELVGMLSERDLAVIETFPDVDPTETHVEDAMSIDVFAVQIGTPVAEVAHRMAHGKLGAAIVQRGEDVVGIFTTVDALRALDFLLSSPGIRQALHAALVPANTARVS